MDERAINGAAIAAISDLELDCEIKDVRKGGEENEWCIQFSGKYGQFCDVFQNQFGKENSAKVIREKIKSHLIKQVNKIRSNTGRRRKPAVTEALESRDSASGLLTEPLKVIGEAIGRATGLAGEVISRASDVAETARATLAAADLDSISPALPEVRNPTGERLETAPVPPGRRTGRTTLLTPAKAKKAKKAKKATKRVARPAAKQAKKSGASVPKKRARKAAKKAARKNSRRVK